MKAPARREQLLDAAKAVVADEGFHGVSIEAVARRAGITRPIVYRHFDDLGALLEALVERETVRALGQLQEFVPRELGGDPREALIAALRGYLAAVESDPVTWRLMLVPAEGAPGPARASGSPPAAPRSSPSWEAPSTRPTRSSPPAPCRPWPTRRRGCCSPTPSATPPSARSTTRAGCSSRLLDKQV